MGNGKMKWKIEYGKLIFSTLFCFRFTVYNEEQIFCSGNRTEWSPIRSVIMPVITKSDDGTAGVRFVYHEYNYQSNWTTRTLTTS